jgi:CheY-like chemotaxis protein
VLIVNDGERERVAIAATLAPLGVAVVEADSGRAALREVLRQPFALILMDVRMPGLNGYETANLIRRRPESRRTPIIFLTASRSTHQPWRCSATARRRWPGSR